MAAAPRAVTPAELLCASRCNPPRAVVPDIALVTCFNQKGETLKVQRSLYLAAVKLMGTYSHEGTVKSMGDTKHNLNPYYV